MPLRRRLLTACACALLLAPCAAPAGALAQEKAPPATDEPALAPDVDATGGTSADTAPGGALDPRRSGALTHGSPAPRRPIARVFAMAPGKVTQGSTPKLRVRIDEAGVKAVRARIVALDAATGRVGARLSLGRVRVGRVVTRTWPGAARLGTGTWLVRLHVKDPAGETLARAASTSGKTSFVVVARPRPEKPEPQPQPQPQPKPAPAPAPAPAPNGTATGVFPVAGSHSYGGKDGGFAAARTGHTHQGQDLPAAEGTPVVSPLAGTVAFVDFQAGGAGLYVVVNADDGRSFFFAHLKAGSATVKPGQRVGTATTIAAVGSTGASTGPHLHFEIWIGGWRDRGGHPVDPLAQLRAWDR